MQNSSGMIESAWTRLLKDTVQTNTPDSNVLILGDEKNGKKNLVRKLQGKETSEIRNEGYALEYTYMRRKSEVDESLISIWCMGDTNYVHLIESNKNLQIQQINLIIITVDMSRPGKMFLELEKWANVVKKLYENCDKQYKLKMKAKWARLNPANKEKKSDQIDLANIGEDVLLNNLGVPVLFVLTKSDLATDELENHLSSHGLNIDMLQQYQNFILYKLRSTALKYGAGIIHTSASKNTNIDLLRDYINYILSYKEDTNWEQASDIATAIEQTERNTTDYETASILIGEDSVRSMETLDLKPLFSDAKEAKGLDVKELIPEEQGAMLVLEGYSESANNTNQVEKVTVLDYQTFLARQVKSQTLYKSRSNISIFGNKTAENIDTSGRGMRHSSSFETLYKERELSSGIEDNAELTISTNPNSSITSSDESGLEEAEDFFKNVLKKIKK